MGSLYGIPVLHSAVFDSCSLENLKLIHEDRANDETVNGWVDKQRD